VGFTGHEAVSQLFTFQLDLLAENQRQVPFEKLLGQMITVELELPAGQRRRFHGLVSRVSQGERDFSFTSYRVEMVPQLWLLTNKAQSRIFQHLTVPEILLKVLEGLDVHPEIQGKFHPREYCVQYRETDFNFASRLMEEEGIFYFFRHTERGHTLVLANTPQSHPPVGGSAEVLFDELEGGLRDEDRVLRWEKVQELSPGKYTLFDHSFELPHKHLEADKTILPSVPVGQVTHPLRVGGNERLEIYDYPGGYAKRFDGVNRGGGDQPAELTKVFEDNHRTVGLRMEQEAARGLVIFGSGNCRHFASGHRFRLARHFNADGPYMLTSVTHSARAGPDRSDGTGFRYQNNFTCLPLALPYRPPLSESASTRHPSDTILSKALTAATSRRPARTGPSGSGTPRNTG
jgi:type VI secretion system secreted protein VgrG